jgi:hypothetical protein
MTIRCGNHKVHGKSTKATHFDTIAVRACFATEGGIPSLEESNLTADDFYSCPAPEGEFHAAESLESRSITAENARYRYGVNETNPVDFDMQDRVLGTPNLETVVLEDSRLVKILRLRLLGMAEREYPMLDVSYIWGELRDGTPVRVDLPGGVWHLNKATYKSQLVDLFRSAGRYAKGMGVFDAISIL